MAKPVKPFVMGVMDDGRDPEEYVTLARELAWARPITVDDALYVVRAMKGNRQWAELALDSGAQDAIIREFQRQAERGPINLG